MSVFVGFFGASGAGIQVMLALLVLLLPCTLLVAAGLVSQTRVKLNLVWRVAQLGAILAIVTAILSALSVWLYGSASVSVDAFLPTVRVDALSCLMLLLTSFLGWVILTYSRHYLAGDQGLRRYLCWLCLTLANVWLLVTLNNLFLVCVAWSTSSLALHQLLIFYKNRPAALIAAHKKFIISRVADVLTWGAALLIYLQLNTLQIEQIPLALAALPQPPIGIQIAALLFVISAILKCAQLPFHGWLLQVMEAPTPVSALLHAGIVNIGGFILLRMTGLIETAPFAQLLLVVVGSVTASLAALVMMTRISVKVMLAWSTCAQMGFMLLEIGLGAYALALLHLLAHSLYKAHAFLSSGETVSRRVVMQIAPANHRLNTSQKLLAITGLMSGISLAACLTGLDPRQDPSIWLFGGVLVGSLLPLVNAPYAQRAWSQILLLVTQAFGLALVYGIWHFIFLGFLPPAATHVSMFGLIFAGSCLFWLLIVQQVVLSQPQGALSRWLHPRAFAGFHLDEVVTHLTLRIWPARLPVPVKTKLLKEIV